MKSSDVFRPYAEAPATTRLRPTTAQGAWNGLRAHRFEVVSRGDFVPGLLYLPPADSTSSSLPLLIIQHGAGGSKESEALECAARWAREGLAVAAIDLPLHGARHSPKLSERLLGGLDAIVHSRPIDTQTRLLVDEVARQSTSDLVRTLDALSALEEIDESRIGYLGFSLGGIVGSYLVGHDPRPRAAILALTGAGFEPKSLDPARYLGEAANCRVLIVAAESDERVSEESARVLFESARKPREWASFPGDHGKLPGAAFAKMRSFLGEALDF